MPVPTSIASLSPTPSSNSPQGSENVGTIMNQYLQAAYAFISQINTNLTTNYNPNGTLTAPSGTRVVMQQASAPAGWTIDTSSTFSDAAVRFQPGAGSQSGTVTWSGFNWGATFTGGATAINVSQMPAHSHGVNDPGHAHSTSVGDPGHSHSVNDPGHAHTIMRDVTAGPNGNIINTSNTGLSNYAPFNSLTSGTGISINGAGTGISVGIYAAATGISTQNNGGNLGHTHTWTTPQVKYADVCVAIKS